MTEIEAIKSRHSVRSYLDKKIEKEKIQEIQQLIGQINEEGNLHLQFMEDAGKAFQRLLSKAMGLASAPSVIVCVGPDDSTLDERVGYYGEKIVLKAQQLGLNTCWAGTFNKKNTGAVVKSGERLVIVIAIGYGAVQGKPRRSKTIDQVASADTEMPDWFRFGVEMALLAPTAVNQQKFHIHLNSDHSVTFQDKGGMIGKVDLGIIKYHFDIAKDWFQKQHS